MKNVVFMIIKPDAVKRGLEQEMMSFISQKEGYEIITASKITMSHEQAVKMYQCHADKPFFDDLTDYMTSDACVIMAVRVPSIESAREFVGNTDPKLAAEGTIRHKFGLEKSRNSIHCSDSAANADYELKIFFSIVDHIEIFPEQGDLGNFYFKACINKDAKKVFTIGQGSEHEYPIYAERFLSSLLYESAEVRTFQTTKKESE